MVLSYSFEELCERQRNLEEWGASHSEFVKSALMDYGAILFRGFEILDVAQFRAAFRVLAGEPLEYTERSSPRRLIEDGVFTSTTYPREREIFLHSEQSYNLRFPRLIAFYCQLPAKVGGETPLADARKIFQRLDPTIIQRLRNLGYLYVRTFSEFGIPWRQAFRVANADELENYCRANDISYEWLGPRGGNLRTRQQRDVVAMHPYSKALAWFNHLTFFHTSSLDDDLRQLLAQTVGTGNFPHATFYGDGCAIDDGIVQHLRDAYRAEETCFAWLPGDILLVDNILVAHGRKPFAGDRNVLVSMAELSNWNEVKVRTP
jgi:alpha-ketoglutarate-dependent taurine dioxygenase